MIACVASLLLPAIWIVDAQMGPGAQFADLPAAIAAAANGDTILVRAGTYTGFYSNGKAVTVRGEGRTSTRIVAQQLGTAAHVVNTGGTFVLSGLRLEGGNPALLLLNATIELLDCDLVGAAGPGQGGPGIVINDADVIAARCTFLGGSAIGQLVAAGGDGAHVAGGSVLVADQCWFLGGSVPGTSPVTQFAGRGVFCGGRARLDGCRARGGNGLLISGAGVEAGVTAIVRITGDATSYVAAGFSGGQLGSALRNIGGTIVRHDPVAVVGGVFGTVAVGQPVPRLLVDGAARADGTFDALQPVQVTLDGVVPNGFGFVAFGEPVFAPPSPPFATELQVGGAGSVVFVTPLDATGRAQFAYTPALIGGPLVGVPVHLQGGAWSPVLGSVLTSNLAVHIAVP